MEEKREFYTLREVVEITGLSMDLLRVYEKEFFLQVARTEGKQRRYTKTNIESFLAIRKKIQEQNWSYVQVRAWLNGEIEPLLEDQKIRSNLEKKVDDMQENQEKTNELLKILVEKMDEQSRIIQQQQKYIEESLKTRDQNLMKHLRIAGLEEQKEKEKPRGLFQRIFQGKVAGKEL